MARTSIQGVLTNSEFQSISFLSFVRLSVAVVKCGFFDCDSVESASWLGIDYFCLQPNHHSHPIVSCPACRSISSSQLSLIRLSRYITQIKRKFRSTLFFVSFATNEFSLRFLAGVGSGLSHQAWTLFRWRLRCLRARLKLIRSRLTTSPSFPPAQESRPKTYSTFSERVPSKACPTRPLVLDFYSL